MVSEPGIELCENWSYDSIWAMTFEYLSTLGTTGTPACFIRIYIWKRAMSYSTIEWMQFHPGTPAKLSHCTSSGKLKAHPKIFINYLQTFSPFLLIHTAQIGNYLAISWTWCFAPIVSQVLTFPPFTQKLIQIICALANLTEMSMT